MARFVWMVFVCLAGTLARAQGDHDGGSGTRPPADSGFRRYQVRLPETGNLFTDADDICARTGPAILALNAVDHADEYLKYFRKVTSFHDYRGNVRHNFIVDSTGLVSVSANEAGLRALRGAPRSPVSSQGMTRYLVRLKAPERVPAETIRRCGYSIAQVQGIRKAEMLPPLSDLTSKILDEAFGELLLTDTVLTTSRGIVVLASPEGARLLERLKGTIVESYAPDQIVTTAD